MIFSCRAHTIQTACALGLILSEPDEYGVPEWIGTQEKMNKFIYLEQDPRLV